MKLALVFASALLAYSTGVYAQSALVGKYSGSLTATNRTGRDMSFGIAIEIVKAEDGKLQGSIQNTSPGNCAGSTPAEGTYEGNNIKFRMTEAAQKVAGCARLGFEGIAEGNKLVGKMTYLGAPRDLTVSK